MKKSKLKKRIKDLEERVAWLEANHNFYYYLPYQYGTAAPQYPLWPNTSSGATFTASSTH